MRATAEPLKRRQEIARGGASRCRRDLRGEVGEADIDPGCPGSDRPGAVGELRRSCRETGSAVREGRRLLHERAGKTGDFAHARLDLGSPGREIDETGADYERPLQ